MQLDTRDAAPAATKRGRTAQPALCGGRGVEPHTPTSYWNALARTSRTGREQLAALGLLPAIRRGLVRFDGGRSVVPVRRADGELVGASFLDGALA